jgi:polyisoprenoid-binding protein YceI
MARPRFALVMPALVALAVAFTAQADGKKYRMQGAPKLTFQITGPVGLKIDGTGNDLTMTDDGSKLTFKAGVTKLDTGIGVRDDHLREHIGAAKYPHMTLVIDKAAVKAPGSGTVSGKLTWREKKVDDKVVPITVSRNIKYETKREGGALSVTGSFEVDLKQHALDKACKAGICTGTITKVTATFQVADG